MKSKWPLYIGLVLLTLGIILKTTNNFDPWSLVILLTGVAFKMGYIIFKIVSKEYKPGFEIVLLTVGLSLFLGGILLNKQGIIENPAAMKIIGILFKVGFIVVFIKKTRIK